MGEESSWEAGAQVTSFLSSCPTSEEKPPQYFTPDLQIQRARAGKGFEGIDSEKDKKRLREPSPLNLVQAQDRKGTESSS